MNFLNNNQNSNRDENQGVGPEPNPVPIPNQITNPYIKSNPDYMNANMNQSVNPIQAPVVQQPQVIQQQGPQPQYQPKDQYKNATVMPPTQPNIKKPSILKKLNPFNWFVWIIRQIINFLNLIRNLLLLAFTLFILGCLGMLFVVLYKPPFLWNPLKTYLNNDIQTPDNINESTDNLYLMINEKAKRDSVVTLTETQFSKIAFTKLEKTDGSFLKLQKDKIFFYINTDTKERPLWSIISINVQNDEKMKIQTFGCGRFDSPQMVSGFLNDTLGTVFSFAESLVTAKNNTFAFNELVDKERIDKALILQDVKVDDGKIQLTYHKDPSSVQNGY